MTFFPLDDTEYEAKELGAWCYTRTRGVYSADTHYATTSTNSMEVMLSPGIAWMKLSEFWGVYSVEEEATSLTVDIAHGSLPRIDVVCIRFDKNLNTGGPMIKKGTPALSPTIPAIERNLDYEELYVSAIRVRAGATAITPSDITDLRLNEEYCGIMRDGVDKIPTQALFENWQDWFSSMTGSSENSFTNWFDGFTLEKAEVFTDWLSILGQQLEDGIGNALFAFAVEDGNLFLYYSDGINPDNFYIEDGHLFYEAGENDTLGRPASSGSSVILINNLTTAESGKGVLDAYQGYLLKGEITEVDQRIDQLVEDGIIQSIVPGDNITVDNTDPANPVISATGGGGGTGEAATIEVGTVTTGEPDTSASVTNTGTSQKAVFDFVIPRGEIGASGKDGKSPYIGESGNWFIWEDQSQAYTDTGISAQGIDGTPGQDGKDGAAGAVFTPSVSAAGVISWSNNGGLANPSSVNIKGDTGPQGAKGDAGQSITLVTLSQAAYDALSTKDANTLYAVY